MTTTPITEAQFDEADQYLDSAEEFRAETTSAAIFAGLDQSNAMTHASQKVREVFPGYAEAEAVVQAYRAQNARTTTDKEIGWDDIPY